jgi:hypothetical protein
MRLEFPYFRMGLPKSEPEGAADIGLRARETRLKILSENHH